MENKEFKILPVVRKYVELKKRGSNYSGLCPFHEEKISSFVVSEKKNLFKCFGCGRGGSPIHFIMELNEVSFKEAQSFLSTEFKDLNNNKAELELQLFDILKEFESHTNSVRKLMNFDRFVLDFCIHSLKDLEEKIKSNHEIKITNVRFLPSNTIKALESIKLNDSMREQYESIFNQCLVLLVSYFSSICKELFKKSIDFFSIHNKEFLSTIKEDIKLSFEEMAKYNYNLSGNIGQIVVDKKNISFQDMQSINRSFCKYLDTDKEEIDNKTNNIILAQASRHCIVHTSEIADEKFFHQIRNAKERDVIKSIDLNNKISVTPDEIEIIISSMEEFLQKKTIGVLKQIPNIVKD